MSTWSDKFISGSGLSGADLDCWSGGFVGAPAQGSTSVLAAHQQRAGMEPAVFRHLVPKRVIGRLLDD